MWTFLKTLLVRSYRHGLFDLAAQLSFYLLLSLFPFLLFALTLLAYLPFSAEYILSMLDQYVPLDSMTWLETNIRHVLEVQRPNLLSFSLLIALWSASNGSDAVVRALNRAYDVRKRRPFIQARLVALGLVLGMFILFVSALVLPVFGRILGLALFDWLGLSDQFFQAWELIRWLISFFILMAVFNYLYILAPNHTLRLKDVWQGALLATVGWHLLSLGFSYYVNNWAKWTAMYGGVGGVMIFMLWLYLAGLVLLLGGEFNSTLKLMQKAGPRDMM